MNGAFVTTKIAAAMAACLAALRHPELAMTAMK